MQYSQLDAYRSHSLNITMKTSSGDTLELDLANEQSLSMKQLSNGSSTQSDLSFSSMHSFKFQMNSNGIDAQDKKEIAAFMELAQPYLDNFFSELQTNGTNTTPMRKTAQSIASQFQPLQNSETLDYKKGQITQLFDNSFEKMKKTTDLEYEKLDSIFTQAQTLLQKTLEELDNFGKSLYA